MNEAFLWYLWKYRLYNKELRTTDGEAITVAHPGDQNHDAGPDFFNARIRIGDTQWAGNVEVHVKSGDWLKHQHQHDRAFDNVILHVVLESDKIIRRPDGQVIPVVELKNNFELWRWESYQKLADSTDWIPCARLIKDVDPFLIQQWLERVLIGRLEQKTTFITDLLSENKGNWATCFYMLLARNFGFKVNAVPFELLARSLPLKVLSRHKNNLFQLEALLLGQAGLLSSTYKEDYPKSLFQEFEHLKNKHGLQPIERHLWKFGRLRPNNFPTIRLVQFAQLIHYNVPLLSSCIDQNDSHSLRQLFNITASEYWNTHYQPDKVSKYRQKSLGQSAIDNIIVNTVVPFIFIYGKKEGDEHLSAKALKWLEECPSEENVIIRGWRKMGLEVKSASQSQALIELKKTYCMEKKCLICNIGIKLLNQ